MRDPRMLKGLRETGARSGTTFHCTGSVGGEHAACAIALEQLAELIEQAAVDLTVGVDIGSGFHTEVSCPRP